MLDGILKKLFGDKNQKDLNELLPIVDSTNEAFEKIQDISDDDLRKKTQDFKDVINNACKDFKNQVQDLKEQAKSDQLNISEKEVLYEKIESIENRLVVFDSKTMHSGSTTNDSKARFVINLNYIPR